MKKASLIVLVWLTATFSSFDQLVNFMNSKNISPDAGSHSVTVAPSGTIDLVYWQG